MRLTLRTLLAYLDDALSPAETQQVGQQVAASESAQQLIERIKQVTRRRRLTTPDADAPERAVDPNVVAEYLSGTLAPEKAAELEKLCLESDVHLAEVAACHQILTLIGSELAHVPPTARQRMYGLVKGPEADPTRRPPLAAAAPAPGVDEHDEEDETLLLGLPSYRRTSPSVQRWASIAAVLVLAVALVTVLVLALGGNGRGQRGPTPLASRPTAPATSPIPPEQLTVAPREVNPLVAWVGESADMLHGAELWTLWTSWAAARPAVPGLLFIVEQGGSTVVAPEPPSPSLPPGAFPPVKAPNNDPVAVASLSQAGVKDGLLLRRVAADDWRLVRPRTRILTGQPLVSLPGYRSEIALDNRLRLERIGNVPEISVNPVLEAAAQLHHHSTLDLDLTLLRGRVLIGNRPSGESLVRVRFRDQVWDLRLLHPASEVGLELTSRIARGSGPWTPRARLSLITFGGEVELRRGPEAKPARIKPGSLVLWDSVDEPGVLSPVFPMPEPPAWVHRRESIPEAVTTAAFTFRKRILDRLSGPEDEDTAWLQLALDESAAANLPLERRLAVFSMGAVDYWTALIKAVDDPDQPTVRRTAYDTILHWLGRQPQQDEPLRAILLREGYSAEDAQTFVQLLKGFDSDDRPTRELLIGLLTSKRLALREQAYLNLIELAPEAKTVRFDPAGGITHQREVVEALRAQLLK